MQLERHLWRNIFVGFNGRVVNSTVGEVTRAVKPAHPRSGSRRDRLESRRRSKSQRYGRFLGLAALGTLVPGVGLWAAGRRRIGAFLITLLVLGLAGIVAVAVMVPRARLAAVTVNRNELLVVGGGLAAVAAVWLVVALASHRALEPRGLSAGRRLGGALVVTLAASVVVTPMAVGVQNVLTQRGFVSAISSDGKSNTTPVVEEEADPWADKPRVNLLLLGGDGGEGREGVRPDSQIVASIDTKTGDTALFSLPRNLERAPFPEDSPLDEIYPNGYSDGEELINEIYRTVPANHPEVFEGVTYPGADANKWAVEGALGIDVDYFVLVNLTGFQQIVDALGGITIDVPRDIPIGNKSLPNGGCTRANGYVEAGPDQHLDGYEALWFARSRCGSDDYDRMERQRCVIGAIVREADPVTMLTRYQQLVAATQDIVETDIPEGILPAFVELALKVKDASVTSLPFTSSVINPAAPDYDLIHALVQEALTPPVTPSPAATSPSTSASPPAQTTEPVPTDPSQTPVPEPDEAAEISAVC